MRNFRIVTRLFALMALLAVFTAQAFAAPGTQIEWYGHSAFKITTPTGKVVLVDPWITNPANKTGQDDVANIGKVDLILITHGHFDHVGDASQIAAKTGAPLVAIFELSQQMAQYGGYPKDQATMATAGNVGGELSLLNGDVSVAFVNAVHSSGLAGMATATDPGELHYGGNPCGFVISVKNGPAIYHTGDTGLYSDMALIPKMHKIDVMLCCIGDKFTMGPDQAAQAVAMVQPTTVIPMHYGTFPVLTGTPETFATALQSHHVKSRLRVMHIHDTLTF